ncbi:MAG: hypothetical protein NWF14_07710 [Candidatus Bathyarchaeota archaeon]|nr:hypothetical protein [Candidatus Bathyarchaeota archaeon]
MIVIILAAISTCLTLYTIKAHAISMEYIYEDAENTFWCRGPSGSLFPWPTEPGRLEILSQIDETDLFIYRHLIKSWMLVGLSILLWVATG